MLEMFICVQDNVNNMTCLEKVQILLKNTSVVSENDFLKRRNAFLKKSNLLSLV